MALVGYPDSDDEGDQVQITNTLDRNSAIEVQDLASPATIEPQDLRKKTTSSLPALPSSFHSLYASNVRTSPADDPALHGGRKRQVPHVEGNWPTHVYLEWCPSYAEAQTLSQLINRTAPTSTTLLHSSLGAQLPLHISLSAPLVLATNQHTTFLESWQREVARSNLSPFTVTISRLDWTPNADRSRWFLVLRLARPDGDVLNTLLYGSARVCRVLDLPELYHEARWADDCTTSFHVSIAWQLEDPGGLEEVVHPRSEVPPGKGTPDAWTLQPVREVDEAIAGDLPQFKMKFDCLKVKIGNVVQDLKFR